MARITERAGLAKTADGHVIEAVTLSAAGGQHARVLSIGATLQAFTAPYRYGEFTDVVLGFDDPADYARHASYWGTTVGRYANRIAGGNITIDGRDYALSRNDGANTLHGGADGFDRRPWTIVSTADGDSASVTFELVSPDGDQGFPGRLVAHVTYSLDDAGVLTIDHHAVSDAPTVVNLTNHAMFNLAGARARQSILDHRLTVVADRYLPVDEAMIPLGELQPVDGSAFDLRTPCVIGDRVRDARDPQLLRGSGYDHCFVLNGASGGEPRLAARVEHPASGRVLEVLTDQPGIQVYTGNFLDGTLVGKDALAYRMSDALALEPQNFPNSPGQSGFPSSVLRPGETYRHRMIYRFAR